jgi:hypothetical protein
MSLHARFMKHANGLMLGYVLSLGMMGSGMGRHYYSARHAHGETPDQRIPICHSKHRQCETDKAQLEACLMELKILHEATRLHATVFIMFGLVALMGVGGFHALAKLPPDGQNEFEQPHPR